MASALWVRRRLLLNNVMDDLRHRLRPAQPLCRSRVRTTPRRPGQANDLLDERLIAGRARGLRPGRTGRLPAFPATPSKVLRMLVDQDPLQAALDGSVSIQWSPTGSKSRSRRLSIPKPGRAERRGTPFFRSPPPPPSVHAVNRLPAVRVEAAADHRGSGGGRSGGHRPVASAVIASAGGLAGRREGGRHGGLAQHLGRKVLLQADGQCRPPVRELSSL